MPNNITLALGKKIVRTIDKDRLNSTVKEHCLNRGLTDVIKDVHAQFTIKDHPTTYHSLSVAAVDRKIASLYNGELATKSQGISVEEILEMQTIDALEALLKKKKAAAKAA